MERFIDLHAHTTFSDGSMTPEELIAYACEKKLAALAITDHDTVAGVKHLMEADFRPSKEIEIVPGIELSSKIKGFEIHILGYYIDPGHPGLTKTLRHLKDTRAERNVKMARRLMEMKVPITEKDLRKENGGAISRAHMADLLVKKGFAPDYNTAFDRYLSSHGLAYVERERLSPRLSIEAITQAGGVAVLAHLNQITSDQDELISICKTLKGYGLKGIEALYCEYDEGWEAFAAGLIRKLGLLPAGGSDFHGTFKPDLDLGSGYGSLKIPYSFLEGIKKARP